MKKTLIYSNASEKTDIVGAYEAQHAIMQQVIEKYNATNLPPLSGNELHGLFNNTPDFLYQKTTGGESAHLTIGTGANRTHLPVDKSAAMKILSKSAEMQELEGAITAAGKSFLEGVPQFRNKAKFPISSIENIFVIDQQGVLQFTESLATQLESAGNYYVNSDKGNRVFAFATAMVAAYYEHGIDKLSGEGWTIERVCAEVIDRLIDKTQSFVPNTRFLNKDREWESIDRKQQERD